jgi:hypothetical protein
MVVAVAGAAMAAMGCGSNGHPPLSAAATDGAADLAPELAPDAGPTSTATDAGGDATADTVPDAAADTAVDACAVLRGSQYLSVDKLECGLGEMGLSYCNWQVRFSVAGAFSWSHSDVGEQGTYTCSGTDVTGASSRAIGGQLRNDGDELVWDQVTYARVTVP